MQRSKKERLQLAENLRSARCSPFVISKVRAARMRKLITARSHCWHARKCSQRPFDNPYSGACNLFHVVSVVSVSLNLGAMSEFFVKIGLFVSIVCIR